MDGVDYSRTEGTLFNFERMNQLSVVVVGLGALGSEVVRHLGLLGVGSLVLIDPDCIEPSDAAKSLLFRLGAARDGIAKTAAIANVFDDYFPRTTVKTFPCEVVDVGYGALAEAALLFSCVDSVATRLEIAFLASQLGLPVCDGGLSDGARGRVSLLPGGSQACFGCLLSPRSRQALMESADRPVLSCLRPPAAPGIRPAVSTLSSLIAGLQVDVALRWLAGEYRGTGRTVELETAYQPRMHTIRHARSASCPFHRTPDARLAQNQAASPAALLDQLPPGSVLLLDWPLCVRARCPDCGAEAKPMIRLAKFRKDPTCARCGGRNCSALEVLHHMGCDSPWASSSFGQLAQPDQHRYRVRSALGAFIACAADSQSR